MESTLVASVPAIISSAEPVSVRAENTFKVSCKSRPPSHPDLCSPGKLKGGEAYKAAAILAVEGALTMTYNVSEPVSRFPPAEHVWLCSGARITSPHYTN